MYINGLKYACSTCIKGHRSSTCNHVDRPLLEIRKKGRPVTQCSFCRDLRKTKQVHIKCACNDKKGNENSAQPVLIYRQQECNSTPIKDTCQENTEHCTCPSTIASKTLAIPPQQDTPSNVTRDSLLAPLCPTAPLDKDESSSYSWALITSPTTTHLPSPSNAGHHDNNIHLGFTFHKPTSQRFLDGQPRIRKRKSTKRIHNSNPAPINNLFEQMLTIDTLNTDYSLSTPPSSAVSPPNSSSTAMCDPMDLQFDYLTQQLEILSNSQPETNSNDMTNSDELTAILNNVLSQDQVIKKEASPTTSTTAPTPITSIRSQCGSFVPNMSCCQPKGQGESVIITITPLANPIQTQTEQHVTTTRIVTCYCGQQCTCPGCLVHPGNSFLGSDPYTAPIIPSSSSSCCASDEEEHNNNQPSTTLAHTFLPFS